MKYARLIWVNLVRVRLFSDAAESGRVLEFSRPDGPGPIRPGRHFRSSGGRFLKRLRRIAATTRIIRSRLQESTDNRVKPMHGEITRVLVSAPQKNSCPAGGIRQT